MTRQSKNGSPKGIARQLAQPGDPYVTLDGEVVQPIEKKDQLPVVKGIQASKYRSQKRRVVKDLPAPPPQMKGISCVLVFTLLGLADREIAEALGISTDEVKYVKKMPAYGESFEAISQEFIDINSNFIQHRLAAMANGALDNVAFLADNAKRENVRLDANRDILDRGGFVSKAGSKGIGDGNELRILVTDGARSVDVSIGKESF